MSEDTSFTLDARPGRLGVDIWLTITVNGEPTTYGIALTRDEGRDLAKAILGAAGDATERTLNPKTIAALEKPAVAVSAPPVEPEKPPAQPKLDRAAAVAQGFSGSACDKCGSLLMARTGTCETCQACGTTSGCS